jgi:site-specific recombinase XerD
MAYTTNVRTVLKNVNTDKIGTIFMEIVFIDMDTKKKTRRYINTKQKISEEDVIKSKVKHVDRTKLIRQIVDKKLVEVTDKLRSLQLTHGTLTPQIYDQSIVANQHARKTVIELYDEFIKHQETNFEPRTVKKHITVKKLLEEYTKKKNISKLYLNDINQKFYKDFTMFLKKTKKHVPQTVNKYQGCLKTFLKYLTVELELNKTEIQKSFKKESISSEGGAKVVLLKEHVQALVNWQPSNQRYELVRDLFLFQILTGIRYSDLINVNKSYVINDSLSFDMWKVSKRVTIPLHTMALSILQKYNYSLGEKCKSLKNYNLDIKKVCELAGLTDDIHSLKIRLNRKVADNTQLYKLVSTHVGRTTFITNCLISGISPYLVMEYTGHKKIETLSGYMRIAGDMAKDAFTKYEEYFKFSS